MLYSTEFPSHIKLSCKGGEEREVGVNGHLRMERVRLVISPEWLLRPEITFTIYRDTVGHYKAAVNVYVHKAKQRTGDRFQVEADGHNPG